MAAVCQRFDLIERALKLLLGRFGDGRYLVDRRSDEDRTKFPAFLSGNSPSNLGKPPLGLRSSPKLHLDDDTTLRAPSYSVRTKVSEKVGHDVTRRVYVKLQPPRFGDSLQIPQCTALPQRCL